MKTMFFRALLVMVTCLVHAVANSQCAMCRATAESASTNTGGQAVAEALNSGIVYLMVIPYLLLGTVAIVLFRKKISAIFRG